MRCDACKKIWSVVQTSSPGSWHGIEPTLFSDPQLEGVWGGAHHVESDSFLSAVQQRCYICCTIFRDLSPAQRAQASRFRTFYRLTLADPNSGVQLAQHSYELEFTVEILHGQQPIAKQQVLECTGSFHILPKTDLTALVGKLELTPDTFSPECKDQVQAWLQGCVTNHKSCNRSCRRTGSDSVRLLNITTEGCVRLEAFERGDQRPLYVTLSHCWDWGVEMPLKLTLNTLAFLRKGLSTQRLTKRFREAIQIARWMNSDYIWIDALCIEQDSKEDWLMQSNLMGEIYANSYCNIAVTSVGQDKGCFTSRVKEMVEPYAVPDPRSMDAAATHMIGYDDFWSNSLLDSPLHNRGWVLQERTLAPRTIHFGQEQIFWECQYEMACEAYPRGIPSQFRNHKTRDWRQFDRLLECEPMRSEAQAPPPMPLALQSAGDPTSGSVRSAPGEGETARSVSDIWPKVVERFMECKLSVSGDKLVAISGIAQKVANVTGEIYLAGLWKSPRLAESLLWYVLARRQADGTPSHRTASLGRDGYRAPSWSWASLEAKVIWNWPADCGQVFVEIIDTPVKGFENSKMGKISSAEIKLKGSLFHVSLSVLDDSVDRGSDPDYLPEESGRYELRLQGDRRKTSATGSPAQTLSSPVGKESVLEPMIHLDTPLISEVGGTEVYLLPICSGWKGRSGNLVTPLAGLLLRKFPDPRFEHRFERIGIFGLSEEQARIVCRECTTNLHSVEEALATASRTLLTII